MPILLLLCVKRGRRNEDDFENQVLHAWNSNSYLLTKKFQHALVIFLGGVMLDLVMCQRK